MNHENISCTLTGEVIQDHCLYVDEVMQSRLQKVDRYKHKGADEASNKCRERFVRLEEAMKQVCEICKDAIIESGWDKGNFLDSLVHYYELVAAKTGLFLTQSTTTKKNILQFGLACAYMHRRGLAIGNQILFRKCSVFNSKLPRTHSLIKETIKVRAITRAQLNLKDALNAALKANPHLNLAFPKRGDVKIGQGNPEPILIGPPAKKIRTR